MRRIVALSTAALILLSGCSAGDAGQASGGEEDRSTSAVMSSIDESGASVQTDMTGYTQVLDRILQYEEGTAGSSLKAAIVAAELLNWTESTTATQAEIEKSTKDYFENLAEEQAAAFSSRYTVVNGIAQNIMSGAEGIAELLNDAGNPQLFEEYSAEKYDLTRAAIQANLTVE